MGETSRITEVSMEIQSQGSFERAELLARKALEGFGIRDETHSYTMSLIPVEDGSDILEVSATNIHLHEPQ